MENKLVIGILDIVEDKLREFGIMLPADEREGSKDPIVGYHYAELHDRIAEYLEEKGLLSEQQKTCLPAPGTPDFRRVCVLTCTHETRHGTSMYGSVHASADEAWAHVESIKEKCDFEEDVAGEYFDADVDFRVIDVSRLERAFAQERQDEVPSLIEQIQKAESFARETVVSGSEEKNQNIETER